MKSDTMHILTTSITRVMSALISLTLLIGVLAATAPADALTPEEDEFIELINQERSSRGLNPLIEYWDLTDDARAWSDQLNADGSLSHNPDLASITSNWLGLAENVGVGAGVAQLHQAFMDSSQHRAHILDPLLDHIGVGVTHGSGELLWVTIDFMNSNGEPLTVDPTAPDIVVERAAGRDRYATAADISSTMFPNADTVYIATGENYPDALAAGPAAGHANAPVLYVKKNSIPRATINELNRLDPETIIVTGGTAVISDSVYNQLASYTESIARHSGSNRYATAAVISRNAFSTGTKTVYIATGETYPDALVAGPAAITDRAPLLLVKRNSLPLHTRNELNRLNPEAIIIVGGTGNISSGVQAQLASYATRVTRQAGSDRWSTGRTVSTRAFSPATSDIVYIAYGNGWPDSVAGTAAAAQVPGPILLVRTYSIPSATRQELARLSPERIMVFGGTAVVANSVTTTLNTYIK
jgi:putative cell wall-binding protein